MLTPSEMTRASPTRTAIGPPGRPAAPIAPPTTPVSDDSQPESSGARSRGGPTAVGGASESGFVLLDGVTTRDEVGYPFEVVAKDGDSGGQVALAGLLDALSHPLTYQGRRNDILLSGGGPHRVF